MLKNLLKNTDYIVLVIALCLFILGVIGIYSAGYNSTNNTEYIKQLVWFGIMTIIMVVIWTVDYNTFDIAGYIIYIISTILLVVVLFMPAISGAKSWLNFKFFLYQPSELMKIAYILVFSKLLSTPTTTKRGRNLKLVLGLLSFLIPFGLILLQPDFGTAITFIVITLFMLFASGIKYRYILIAIAIILVLVPIIYFFVLSNYQQERILVFLDPSRDPLGYGYNAIQSKLAIGSGKLFGTGLLQGSQTQYGYLPVKSSDFIFSVLSEELGFIISALIVVLFVVLMIRMLYIASNARDNFAKYIVIGITGMIFFHFVENIGMTIGLLPITGIPLPFVSYGGSNLMTNCIALAIVLSISARKSANMFTD